MLSNLVTFGFQMFRRLHDKNELLTGHSNPRIVARHMHRLATATSSMGRMVMRRPGENA
jgi:hypothetical protein